MKSLTIEEAGGHLAELVALAHRGESVLLRDQGRLVILERFDPLPPAPVTDPEMDSPELEAELLRGVRSPHSDYSRSELEASLARIIREETRAGR
jgi:hypothetical protein